MELSESHCSINLENVALKVANDDDLRNSHISERFESAGASSMAHRDSSEELLPRVKLQASSLEALGGAAAECATALLPTDGARLGVKLNPDVDSVEDSVILMEEKDLTFGANSEIINLRRERATDVGSCEDMGYILPNHTSLTNQVYLDPQKCCALGLTNEGTITERNASISSPTEEGSHRGCLREAKCFYAHCEEESWKVKHRAHWSHFSAAKQLKSKISVGGLLASVDSDILDKTKGTTNVVASLENEKKIILGSDSRLTYEGIIRTDVQKKFEQITSNIIATMVGSAGGCEKIWKRMQEYCKSQGAEPKTISSISKYGCEIPRKVDDFLSSECFVIGVENDKPTLYHLTDIYDEKLKERVKDSKKVNDTFAALGTGSLIALDAWNEELNGRSPHLDLAIEAVSFGLLKAALYSSDIGGILRVIQLCSTGIEMECNKTVVELYVQFYERFRQLENRSFFLFYIPNIKKSDLRQWLRQSGTIENFGHPLTQLCGRYYMHRVLFKDHVASTHLGAKPIPKSKWPEFTSSPRTLRFITIGGKKVFVARQSAELLNSLKLADP